jgi:glycosyltransferase involved in cell wall biosynthesis
MTQTGQPIVVSDPGFLPTTRQMALALCPELTNYFTPYCPGRKSRALFGVPRLGQQLARRSLPGDLAVRARSCMTATELLRLGLGRTGIHFANYRLIWARNVGFDRHIAFLVPGGATVIGQYGGSLETFRRVRKTGGFTLMDYPIARHELGQEILREEAQRRPDLADSLFGPRTLAPHKQHLDRIDGELELANVVVVGSSFAAKSFRARLEPERMRVVPYGVDTGTFKPHPERRDDGPLRILFAGQLTQRKGIGDLLDAALLLDPARFEIVLVGPVIGSGRGLGRYAGRFRHVTGIRPKDMPLIYRTADVLVLPSLVEGSALVVLEAMACGVPVVVTPNTGADAVRDGVDGYVVPIRDPEAIAARLVQLEANADTRARMRRSARARALEFDWISFRSQMRAIVDDLRNER